MGITKYLKGTAAVLTVAALAFALNGCGGKKKAEKFSVPVDKLPEGVISVIRPKPNNETIFVRALVQEAVRRNVVARQYNEALIHYDMKKGNAKDHERLLKKTKKAWQEARNAASVATFYAMGLSQLERTEGYDPYQKTAMLRVPEIRLMPTAYAKEKGKLNTKEEVYSKIHGSYKVGIKKEIDKFPEGKQLLAISTMYHTSGQTACEIMKDVNPDYNRQGKSWEEIGYDVAYRGANVAKTAGKIAGVGLAAVGTAAVATPVAVIVGGIVVTVKIVDTGLDAIQTGMVVFTGEEDKELNKALAVTGTADTIVSLATFDLTKPVLGKGLPDGAKLADYTRGGVQGSKDAIKLLSGGQLKDAAKLINPEGINNALGVTTGVIGLRDNYDTLTVSSRETEDGRIETRSGALNVKNGTEEDKLRAKALGLLDSSSTMDDLKKKAEAAKQVKANSATATSAELEKGAEEAANAGGANQYKEIYQTFVDASIKGLINTILGSGGNMNDLSKILSEAAGEEMKATGIMVSKDNQGNITKVTVVGEKKNAVAPFASSKVAGTYHVYVPKEKKNVTVAVRDNGGKLSVTYSYHWGAAGHEDEKATVEGPFTPAYDPQTGRGSLGEYVFQFTNNGGQMSLTVR